MASYQGDGGRPQRPTTHRCGVIGHTGEPLSRPHLPLTDNPTVNGARPAAWYRDPHDPAWHYRYWDGHNWTDHNWTDTPSPPLRGKHPHLHAHKCGKLGSATRRARRHPAAHRHVQRLLDIVRRGQEHPRVRRLPGTAHPQRRRRGPELARRRKRRTRVPQLLAGHPPESGARNVPAPPPVQAYRTPNCVNQ